MEDEGGKRKELQRELGAADDRLTLSAAIKKNAEKQASDRSLRPTTRSYYQQVEKALLKSLGDLGDVETNRVTEKQLMAWAVRR